MLIPIELLLPMIFVAILIGLGFLVFLMGQYGTRSVKLKQAQQALAAGRKSEALKLFRKVAHEAVASSEFKIFPWEPSALEKAVAGMEAVYEGSDRTPADIFAKLRQYHAKFEELQKSRRSGNDPSADQARLRAKGQALLEKLP